ncbi:ArsR family transcriptional regulator [Klebsiella pneumoniae]|nr:ArsR family transcriptional regulator [Klebsiella pneumoniae]
MFCACILILLCGPVCCPSRLRRNHVFIAPATVQNLADETRLGIVLLLKARGELCVCDLCTALAQSQPKISRHLAMLRESGLLLDRKQGKWVHYRLSPQMPAWAAQVIEQAWLSQQEDVRLMISRLAGGPGCR